MFEPAGENRDGCGLDIDELETHTNSGLNDANHGKRFDAFAFALQGDAGAGPESERLAGANEAAAKRKVRGNALGADAGLEIKDLRIGSEGITDSVAAVAEAYFVRHAIGSSVVHGDNVAHGQIDRGRVGQDEPEERSPLCNKGARDQEK
jgi:hypothetical protein